METDRLLPQLLQGTRRRIVLLLRTRSRTVRELADSLDLTRNAIRSQLSKLQRDGLADITGRRPTGRKPENVYGLTRKAEQLFPKSYDDILNALLTVLAEPEEDRTSLLRTVGRQLAQPHKPHKLEDSVRERLERVKDVLEKMGGLPIIEKRNGTYRLEGASCPLASVVDSHGELACTLATALIEELIEKPVEQRCQLEGDCPECTFLIDR